MRLTFWYLTT
uniref:Uncharacterized protein n=1 Tax=Rhizophora mucronata TaxID=61149 RepID=A0A2P2NJ86_RHIMU